MTDYTNFYLQVLVPGLIPRPATPIMNIGSNFYFDASSVTASHYITLPNKTGTLATIEDLAGLGGSGVPLATVATSGLYSDLIGSPGYATVSVGGLMSSADKTKLDGIATGATANSTDAFLLNRSNHTGAQPISTVTGLQTALDTKAPIDSPTFTGTVTLPVTSGSVMFAGTGGTISENNSKLFWDSTNNRFGLSTTVPRTTMDISSDSLWDGIVMSAVTAVASDTGGTVAAGTYYFKVVATTKGGVTAGSAETAGAIITTNTGKVTISWSAVPGAVTYNIYRTTTSGTYTSPSLVGQTSSTSFVWTTGQNISGGTPQTTENISTIANSKLFASDLYTTTGPNYASFNFNTVSSLTSNSTDIVNAVRAFSTVPADNPYNHGLRRGMFVQNIFGGSGTAGQTIGITSNSLYYGSGSSSGNIIGVQTNALAQGTNPITISQVVGVVSNATANTTGKVNSLIGVSAAASTGNLGDIAGGAGQIYGGYMGAGHGAHGKTVDAVWGTYGIASVSGTNGIVTRLQGGYFQSTVGNGAGGGASSSTTHRGVEAWAFVQSTGTAAASEGGTFSVTNYGNITSNANGISSTIYNDTANTLPVAKGVDISVYRQSGTITTSYGVYIGPIQGTTTYGVFQADSTVKNKFSGVTSFNGVQQAITTKTANYTVTSNDYTVLVDTTSGNVTITLPDANTNTGGVFVIKKISSDNTVTINTTSSQPIDGSLTYTLTSNFSKVTVQSTGGSAWYTI